MAAAIKEQERLENIRRAEDKATLRREIEEEEDEEDVTDAAIENQRRRLEKAASVRFVDTDCAHQRKLKAISDAAKAKKKQPLPPRAPRGTPRRQTQRIARPTSRSQVDIENFNLLAADEEPSDDEEVFSDSAPLSQRDLVRLMSETMASAIDKAEKRGQLRGPSEHEWGTHRPEHR